MLDIQDKLDANSALCREIIETGFMSKAKGDGLKPYRFNDDDQKNIMGIIIFRFLQGITINFLPMFDWKNANELSTSPTWSYEQIESLYREFEEWKERVLKRQDEIKVNLMIASEKTQEDIDAVDMSYDDLLAFE